MAQRSEFTTLAKLKAMARYIRCPGVFELGIKCGKKFGSLSEIQFDHVKRCEIEPECYRCHKHFQTTDPIRQLCYVCNLDRMIERADEDDKRREEQFQFERLRAEVNARMK